MGSTYSMIVPVVRTIPSLPETLFQGPVHVGMCGNVCGIKDNAIDSDCSHLCAAQ